MWIKSSTQLSDDVFQVTTPASSHFLIVGDELALVDTGIAAFQETLVEEIRPFVAGGTPLRYVFLTHAHFDHIGGLPALRQFAPDLVVVGAPQTEEILKDKDFLQKCYEQNVRCCEAVGQTMEMSLDDWASAMRLDRVVSEGDSIILGDGVEVKVVSCPGHAPDCLAYFVKPDSALAAGEAVGGYHGRDKVVPCFLSNFDDYVSSFEKFLSLDVKVLGLSHAGALTADLAKKFLASGRAQAEAFVRMIGERVESGAIKEEIYFDLLNEWAVEGISPEGPFLEAQQDSLRRMIELVLENSPAAPVPDDA